MLSFTTAIIITFHLLISHIVTVTISSVPFSVQYLTGYPAPIIFESSSSMSQGWQGHHKQDTSFTTRERVGTRRHIIIQYRSIFLLPIYSCCKETKGRVMGRGACIVAKDDFLIPWENSTIINNIKDHSL